MQVKWKWGAVLGAVLIAATVAGCAGRVGENGRVGVVYLNAEGYYAGVARGLNETFAELPDAPQVLASNIQSDASKESTFVDTIASVKADALIISPSSATASVPALRLAHDNGVPIICYNTCVEDTAARELVSAYVLGDPEEFGAASGRQMAAYFREQGITAPKVAVINCEQFEVCVQRRMGFEKALTAAVPGATIVANQQGLTLDEAVQRAEQVLTAQPDIDAFYGEAGSQMIGAARAVQARGKAGEVVVFGGDMSTQAAGMLRDGTVLKGVTDISGIKVGDLAGRAAVGILAGNPPADFVIPAPVDEYVGPQAGADWIETHPDGIP
ncbi:substrate-binding domain-containing protein [Nocardia carnea]|uniref:substrate-binding domain-containing protein n=1 Tax=Nocardia carnea TaxID=37328 RepID=UPI002456A3F1|nr:substrate-binding domain-containing protein [Nocardia carnea]